MHSLRRRGLASVLAVGITAVLLAAPTAKAAAPTPEGEAYRVIDLGTLNGSDSSEAFAVNERGHAAGQSDGHATLWRNSRVIDLGVLPGGLWSVATDLNDRDEVVGYGSASGGTHAFLVGAFMIWTASLVLWIFLSVSHEEMATDAAPAGAGAH